MRPILNISEAANLGIHALAHLASVGVGRMVPVGQIGENLQVSESHLAKVLQRLTHAGLVCSSRGARGGFMLERDPDGISLREVVEAIDGPFAGPACLLGRPVCKGGSCLLTGPLNELLAMVQTHLGRLSIGNMRITTPGKRPDAVDNHCNE